MERVKKHAAMLVLTAILYFVYFFTHSASLTHHTMRVLGASTNVQLFEEPRDGHQPFLTAIQNAQKNIDLEIYLLSDKQIIAALLQAKTRGIQERIILEQHPFGGGSANKKTQQVLLQAGIPMHWASSSFALTHEKMLIIDQNVLFILNQNLSASSFSKNREFNMRDADTQDIEESEKQFTADWDNTQFIPTDPHLLVSPDTSRSGLTQLITSALKAIDIEMEVINDPALIAALIQKAKTVRVRLIVPDFVQISANKDPVSKLQQGGISVRAKHRPYIHAKLMIIDASQAYIGSINFSTESLDQNREIGIAISQPDVLQQLEQDFEADWQSN